MTSSICQDPRCGHEEYLHGFDERPCFVQKCPCKKFIPKDDNHSPQVSFRRSSKSEYHRILPADRVRDDNHSQIDVADNKPDDGVGLHTDLSEDAGLIPAHLGDLEECPICGSKEHTDGRCEQINSYEDIYGTR